MDSETYSSIAADADVRVARQMEAENSRGPLGSQNVKMHEVRYFVLLARTLNFTSAADLANVSQPAFSRAIRKLESKLGGQLIIRGPGGAVLTALGKSLLPSLTQCLDLVVGIEASARTRELPARAVIRIAIANSVGIASIAAALAAPTAGNWRTNAIAISRLDGWECLESLERGDCDFAIAPMMLTRADSLVATSIYSDHLGLLAPSGHPIFAHERPVLNDVGTAFLVERRYCEYYTAVSGALVNSGKVVARRISISCDDQLAPLQCALGIPAIAPSSLCGRSQRWCPIDDLRISRRVSVFERRGHHRTAAGQSLVEALARIGGSVALPVVNGVWSQEVPV